MMKFVFALIILNLPSVASAQDWLDPFRAQVSQCWNPQGITESVTVRMRFDENARAVDDMALVGIDDPTPAQQDAFMAARRAILRCQGADGYDLPVKEYEIWRDVEMTFTLPTAAGSS